MVAYFSVPDACKKGLFISSPDISVLKDPMIAVLIMINAIVAINRGIVIINIFLCEVLVKYHMLTGTSNTYTIAFSFESSAIKKARELKTRYAACPELI